MSAGTTRPRGHVRVEFSRMRRIKHIVDSKFHFLDLRAKLPTNCFQFSMSLWAVDVGLKAASMNYSAIVLHTREFEIQYNLFDPPSPHTPTDPGWRIGSPYYAALFLSEFTSPGGSVVINLNLNNSITSPYAAVAGYGIYSDSGAKRETLVFINFARDSQVFVLPQGFAQKVEYKLLVAPDVLERTNISWAGKTIGNNRNLEGDEQLIKMSCENACRVTIPGPGAVLIALANSPLFTGNSTIAAIGAYMSGDEPEPGHPWTCIRVCRSSNLATYTNRVTC